VIRETHEVSRNYGVDEGRPLGATLQEGVPNHLKRRRSKAGVVSVKEKVAQAIR